MAARQMDAVIRHLRKTAFLADCSDLDDGRLLERFVRRRDEAAFAVLVRRHGPMVLGVCRRILGNHHDVEDVFQATFLVLVHKAAALLPRETIGNWLYGVAYHSALKARAAIRKRRAKERQVPAMHKRAAHEEDAWGDLLRALDDELNRLPDKYREPVVLCDLEGKTRKEAARQLGVPEGTLSTRLGRARARLARGLARRGVTVSGATLAAVLAEKAAPGYVPNALVSATVRAASLFTAGGVLPAGLISGKTAMLMKGVLKTMSLTKLRSVTVLLVAVSLVALGGSALMHRTAAEEPLPDRQDRAEARQRHSDPQGKAIIRADGETNADVPNTTDSQKAEPRQSDKERLQGTWRVAYAEKNGQPNFSDDTTYTFSAGLVLIKPRSAVAFPYTLSVSGDRKIIAVGVGEAVQKGVYLLEDDVLVHRYAYESYGENEQRVRITILRVLRREKAAYVKADRPGTRDEAVVQLSMGRRLLAQGKLDEAERIARIAQMNADIHWGLFDDSPTKLLHDVRRAKQAPAGTGQRPSAADEGVLLSKPSGATTDPTLYEVSTRQIKIPVAISAEQQADIKEVRLLVSADLGRTWQRVATISPDDDAFRFSAPQDGLYWLVAQTVHKNGIVEPHDRGPSLRPNLKILVKSSEARNRPD
jgi:RNA polymerase sigma factor (sigma-70 family)